MGSLEPEVLAFVIFLVPLFFSGASLRSDYGAARERKCKVVSLCTNFLLLVSCKSSKFHSFPD